MGLVVRGSVNEQRNSGLRSMTAVLQEAASNTNPLKATKMVPPAVVASKAVGAEPVKTGKENGAKTEGKGRGKGEGQRTRTRKPKADKDGSDGEKDAAPSRQRFFYMVRLPRPEPNAAADSEAMGLEASSQLKLERLEYLNAALRVKQVRAPPDETLRSTGPAPRVYGVAGVAWTVAVGVVQVWCYGCGWTERGGNATARMVRGASCELPRARTAARGDATVSWECDGGNGAGRRLQGGSGGPRARAIRNARSGTAGRGCNMAGVGSPSYPRRTRKGGVGGRESDTCFSGRVVSATAERVPTPQSRSGAPTC